MTEPLETVTTIFGGLLLAFLALVIVTTVFGSGSVLGFGHGDICTAQPYTTYGSSQWAGPMGVTAHPGTSISINGTVQACAEHPGLGQRVLYTVAKLPSTLLWACILFLLWRLIRTAGRTGPFTVPVAAAMRRLGWLIIVGSAAAAVVQSLALSQLLRTIVTLQDWSPGLDLGIAVVRAVLPIPALAGAALLTFARIIGIGADMDDEIKGTV
ncbi:MAG TPA: hypothetical protein VFB06_04480 [Streptosporangiaceae bacterium]|nr:hypothetical protein [Streptosporangiaceae bacterium]